METFLIRTLQLILSLSILVFLHELGHFTFARVFKVRVEKFYLFFNPYFSLLRAKKINGKWQYKFFVANVPVNTREKKSHDGTPVLDSKGNTVMETIPLAELDQDDWRKYPETTEWGIGWLPLGGYCKIAGMIDESMDTAAMAQEPQEWEYRSRSVWQRLPIIIGGVLVNFILAMVIFSAVLFTWGKDILPLKNAKYGLSFTPTMQAFGFQNGDKIISVDGEELKERADLVEKILIEGKQHVDLIRNGHRKTITLPSDFNQQILASGEKGFAMERFPFVIDSVLKGSPAHSAGLMKNDSLVAINGDSTSIYQDATAAFELNKNKPMHITVIRKGEYVDLNVTPDENGKIGVMAAFFTKFLATEHISYGLIESIPAGIKMGWETLTGYVKQFKLVFTKEGSKQLGGFGSIGKMFPTKWDWQIFWTMTAVLSMILAFMNFLPIPALDGGYVLFLIYELITRKKPGEKFLEYAQTVGMVLLFALLIYSNGNDIFRAFFK
jgi:regulator of sigma E protease